MKNIVLSILFFSLLFLNGFSQELTLDQILEKYHKACCIEKLQKINSVIMSGHITKQDFMPLKIIRLRPDKYKMEFDVADLTCYQSFDGKTAWMTAPWTGNAKPQAMQPDAANDIIAKADFEGVLYMWKEKGHTAELIGKDKVNDSETFKIKLTRKDGGIEYYFIDSSNYLLQKKIVFRMSRGKEIEVASFYSDYRDVEGIKFSFKNDNLMGGEPYSTIEFDSIELNKAIDETIFSMPE